MHRGKSNVNIEQRILKTLEDWSDDVATIQGMSTVTRSWKKQGTNSVEPLNGV